MPITRNKSYNNLTGEVLGLLREGKDYIQKKLQDPATHTSRSQESMHQINSEVPN